MNSAQFINLKLVALKKWPLRNFVLSKNVFFSTKNALIWICFTISEILHNFCLLDLSCQNMYSLLMNNVVKAFYCYSLSFYYILNQFGNEGTEDKSIKHIFVKICITATIKSL